MLWALTDHQGTVRDVLDTKPGNPGQAPTFAHLRYDAFGAPNNGVNTLSATLFANEGSLGYLGLPYDSVVSLYFENRPYDRKSGRYLTENSAGHFGGASNLYEFAGNTPVNRTVSQAKGQAPSESWGTGFGQTYQAYNPYWTYEVAAIPAILAPVTGGQSLWVYAAGGAAGATDGAIQAYAAQSVEMDRRFRSSFDPIDVMMNGGLGALGGALNPINGFAGLAGGAAGAGLAAGTGNDWRTGYQIGSLAAGIATGGIDDAIRVSRNGGAFAKAISHGMRHAMVQGTIAGGAGLAAYAATGSVDSALLAANIGSVPGGAIASRLVACFAAGTPLLIPDGNGFKSKPIEEFRRNDWIISRNENDPAAPLEAMRVEDVFVARTTIVHLHVGGQVIRTTREHPFYVEGKGWTPCGELRPGDELGSHDDSRSVVEEIFDTGEVETVYNLRVADNHTYFVGDSSWGFSVWAHNACRVSGNDPALRGLTMVSAAQADRSFADARRYLDIATEEHHPFFRMFLRAMDESGLYPQVRGGAGKMRPQDLDVLETALHRDLHASWNDFALSVKAPYLQATRGNAKILEAELSRGNITPTRIFEHLETFYLRADIADGIALNSVRNLRARLGF